VWRIRVEKSNPLVRVAENKPTWYFIDEAGDPTFYGKGKGIIVGKEGCSRILALGFIQTFDPQQIRQKLLEVRESIANSRYLKDVPSIKKSLIAFHAKDDCPEVRQMVYEALSTVDFHAQIVVARKREHQFRVEFKGSQDKFYDNLVHPLLFYRTHLHTPATFVFSRRGNKPRERSLSDAVESVAKRFREKYTGASPVEITVKSEQMTNELALQAADYVLWSVHRAYEKPDMRYFNFLRDRILLVRDIYDWDKVNANGGKTDLTFYDRKKNPFDISKASPLS
jgi:uncharacterized protein DUF3800